MRGTRAVRLGKEVVYAFFTTEGGTTKLRVSADECDRLDLFTGQQLPVEIDGGPQVRALVVSVTREPPFAWVAVEFTTHVQKAGAKSPGVVAEFGRGG